MKRKKKILYRKKGVLLRPMYLGGSDRGRFPSVSYGHPTANQHLFPADLSVMPFPISSSGDGCIYSSSMVVQSSQVSSEKCSQNLIVPWNRLICPFYCPSKSSYSSRGGRLLLKRSSHADCSGSCCRSRSSASSESSQSCRCRRECPSKIRAKRTEPRVKKKEKRRCIVYKVNKENPVSSKWILSCRYSVDEANMRKTDLTAESGNCSLVTIKNRSNPSKRDKFSDKINNYHVYMMRGSIFKLKVKKPHKPKDSRERFKDGKNLRIKNRHNDSECDSMSRRTDSKEYGRGREHVAREVKQVRRDKELKVSLNDLKSKIEELKAVLYPQEGVDSQPENEPRSKQYGCGPIYVISCENLRQCLWNVKTRERGVQYGTEEVPRARTTDTSVMTDENTIGPTTVEVSTSSECLEQSYDEQPFYNREEDLSDLELLCECTAQDSFLADELGGRYRVSRWPGRPFDRRRICLCRQQQEYAEDRLVRRGTRLYTVDRRNQGTDYHTQSVGFDRDLGRKLFPEVEFACHCCKQRQSAKKNTTFTEPTADNHFSTTSVQTRLPRSLYPAKHCITCRNSNNKNSAQNCIYTRNKVIKCNCRLKNCG